MFKENEKYKKDEKHKYYDKKNNIVYVYIYIYIYMLRKYMQ